MANLIIIKSASLPRDILGNKIIFNKPYSVEFKATMIGLGHLGTTIQGECIFINAQDVIDLRLLPKKITLTPLD